MRTVPRGCGRGALRGVAQPSRGARRLALACGRTWSQVLQSWCGGGARPPIDRIQSLHTGQGARGRGRPRASGAHCPPASPRSSPCKPHAPFACTVSVSVDRHTAESLCLCLCRCAAYALSILSRSPSAACPISCPSSSSMVAGNLGFLKSHGPACLSIPSVSLAG